MLSLKNASLFSPLLIILNKLDFLSFCIMWYWTQLHTTENLLKPGNLNNKEAFSFPPLRSLELGNSGLG